MVDYTLSDMPTTLCRVDTGGDVDGASAEPFGGTGGVIPRSGGSVYVQGPDVVFSFSVWDSGSSSFITNTLTVPSIVAAYGAGDPPDLCRIVDLSSIGIGTRAIIWHDGDIGVYLAGPPSWATPNAARNIPLARGNSGLTYLNGGALFVPNTGAGAGAGSIAPYTTKAGSTGNIFTGLWVPSEEQSLPVGASSGEVKVYKAVYSGGVASRTLLTSYPVVTPPSPPSPPTYSEISGDGSYLDALIYETTIHWPSSPDTVSTISASNSDQYNLPYPYSISPWVEASYGDAYQGSIPAEFLSFAAPTCEAPTIDVQDFAPAIPFGFHIPSITVTIPGTPTLTGRVIGGDPIFSDPYANVQCNIDIYISTAHDPVAVDSFSLSGLTGGPDIVRQYLPGSHGVFMVRAYYSFGNGSGYAAFSGRGTFTQITLP